MNLVPAKLLPSLLLSILFTGFISPAALAALHAPVAQWRDYTDGLAMGVSVVGHHAFVAASPSGLLVFDLSDPANPRRIATLRLAASGFDIVAEGNRAYVAAASAGLEIIDISDPAAPKRLGRADTEGEAWDVALSGNFAYIASTAYGLEVVDVSDETDPRIVGGFRSGGFAGAVAAAGDSVYLGDGVDSFKIFSVTNPVSPTLITNYTRIAAGQDKLDDIVLVGNLAYIADSWNVVVELDVSNPRQLLRGRTISSPRSPYSLRYSADKLYVAASGEFAVLDVTPGAAIEKLGSWSSDYFHRDLALLGNDHVVLSSEISGLHILSITNLAAPELIASYPTQEDATDIVFSGDVALVPGGRTGLALLDLSDPSQPRTLSRYLPHLNVLGAAFFSSNQAIVALGTSGADIIDISARTNISRVATLRGTNVTAVAAEDSIALVAVQTTTSQGAKYFLRILDLSNPAEPTFISEVPITAVVNYILIDGTRAYLSQNSSGFSIIDFSDPLSPQRLSTTDTPGNARKIAVRDGQLFLADNSAGLRIYDITNALAPKLLSTLATPRYANGVAVQNSTAYIANGFSRQLIEVDISDVMFPTAVATNVHIGSPAAVILRGEHIFVAEGSGGVSVYNNGDLPASIQVTVVANGPALEIHAHEIGGRPFTEADLPRLALERSKDLKSWEELPSGASLSDGSAKFLVERTEQDSFYRLVTE